MKSRRAARGSKPAPLSRTSNTCASEIGRLDDFDAGRRLVAGVLPGVLEQVGDDDAQQALVAVHHDVGLDGGGDLACRITRVEFREDVLGHRRDVHRLVTELRATDAGELQ
jgi:hypothetical protein